MKAAVCATPRPASALPIAAAATPARMRRLPTGRRLIVSKCNDHDRERSERVADDREDSGRHEVEMLLRLGDRRAADVGGERCGDPDADREPGVRERDRCGPAPSVQEQRARAEERCGQQRPARVVDAECLVVPPGCRSPGERSCGERVREERRRPRGELRRTCGAPTLRQAAREPERDERGREGEHGIHRGERSRVRVVLYGPPRAAAELQGLPGPDPARWRTGAGGERIRVAGGLLSRTMRFATARPLQQVIWFAGHRPGR